MASRKISDLEENGILQGTDVVPVSDIGGTKTFKLSMDQLVEFVNSEAEFNPTKVSNIITESFDITADTKETIFLINANDQEVIANLNINFAQYKNKILTFKRLNTDETYNVVIQSQPGNPIDDSESVTIHVQYESVTIVSNGVNGWYIL